jgi:hypothetical protein
MGVSLHRYPFGEEGGRFTGDFERKVRYCLIRRPCLLGTLRERWDIVLSGDLVYWGLRKICKRRLWKRAGAPLGKLEGASFSRELQEADEGGLWIRSASLSLSLSLSLSMGALRGGLGGRTLYCGPWWICDGRLWKRTSVSTEAPLGYLEGWFAYRGTLRDSKRAPCKRSVSLCGSCVRETWRDGSFTGNSDKRHVKEGFGNRASLSL